MPRQGARAQVLRRDERGALHSKATVFSAFECESLDTAAGPVGVSPGWWPGLAWRLGSA